MYTSLVSAQTFLHGYQNEEDWLFGFVKPGWNHIQMLIQSNSYAMAALIILKCK